MTICKIFTLTSLIFVLCLIGCDSQKNNEVAQKNVAHISRWLDDQELPFFRIVYDNDSYEMFPMNEQQAKDFAIDRAYHRDMNLVLWDQAWNETRLDTEFWVSFKDRYKELGGTMLFD